MVGSNCALNGKCLVSSSTYLYCTVHFFSLRNVHMRWTMFYFIHTVKEIIMHLTPTYYRIWRVVGYRTVNQTIYTIIFNAFFNQVMCFILQYRATYKFKRYCVLCRRTYRINDCTFHYQQIAIKKTCNYIKYIYLHRS